MSIENFKNPWVDEWKRGGKNHPDWLGGEQALGKTAITPTADDELFQELEDNFDSIDVVIESSPINGVKEMSFVKTHNNNPDRLRVRYIDESGKVQWVGDNFKVGTLEYELFNKEGWYYDVNKSKVRNMIVFNGPLKTDKVQKKFWTAWDRYYITGKAIQESELIKQFGSGRPMSAFEKIRVEPNSLFFFTAYFENHSILKITNQTKVDRIIQDIYKTFENEGRIKVNAVNAYLSARQVAFMVVGYHSPEPTNNSGLNNTKLALGRAKTVQKLLFDKLSPIKIASIGATTGGDSQEFGVRPAITYFGTKAFIDKLGIPYTPPTIGE